MGHALEVEEFRFESRDGVRGQFFKKFRLELSQNQCYVGTKISVGANSRLRCFKKSPLRLPVNSNGRPCLVSIQNFSTWTKVLKSDLGLYYLHNLKSQALGPSPKLRPGQAPAFGIFSKTPSP
jgi:hypothetical protein